MEGSLHRQLKERYGPEVGGRSEVVVSGYRVDAIDADGRLIEIQTRSLGPLKAKLTQLLPSQEMTIVKPVVVRRRVVRRLEPAGIDLSARLSPKRGNWVDVFEDLVGIVQLFPHENLSIDLLAVEIDEIRVARRRRPGYLVVDRLLRKVGEVIQLRRARDFWSILPSDLPATFTTSDLASRIGRHRVVAQKVAYCLRQSGAADEVGKLGNQRVYTRRDVATSV